jgi:RNA polymerase sigma-70 factor (ECF subfamily)
MNETEFLSYYSEIQGRMRAYFLVVTGDIDEARDLFQETSSLLWQKIATYDERRPFTPWAFGFARNIAMRWRRKKMKSRITLASDNIHALSERAADSVDASNFDRRLSVLEKCYEKLTNRARTAVTLFYRERERIQSIARRLHRSTGAVEMILVRARRALRLCVEKSLHD